MNEEPRVPLIRDILIHLPVGLVAGVISGVINGWLNDDLTLRGLLIHTVIFGTIFGVAYGFVNNRWLAEEEGKEVGRGGKELDSGPSVGARGQAFRRNDGWGVRGALTRDAPRGRRRMVRLAGIVGSVRRAVRGACFRNRLVFDGRDVGLATLVEVGATRIAAGRWPGPS